MRCMACGGEMILMNVVQDDTMVVPGFEHHTFVCSECQDVERRLKPTRAVPIEPTQTVPVELTQTVPLEPTQTVPSEPTQAVPLEPIRTVPVEPSQAVPVEPTQTVPVELTPTVPLEPTQTVPGELTQTVPLDPTHPEPSAATPQNAWAKALEKALEKARSLKERATAVIETAQRHAQFNRDWDSFRSVPPPSASSETSSSHAKPDEPVQSPTEPIASPTPTAHHEPIAPASKG